MLIEQVVKFTGYVLTNDNFIEVFHRLKSEGFKPVITNISDLYGSIRFLDKFEKDGEIQIGEFLAIDPYRGYIVVNSKANGTFNNGKITF